MSRRFKFCGVIEGTVTRRRGESAADALERANATVQAVLDRHCRNLFSAASPGGGPVVGLEPANGSGSYDDDAQEYLGGER